MVAAADWSVEDRLKAKRKEMFDILMLIPRASQKDKTRLREKLAAVGKEVKELEGRVDGGRHGKAD